MESNTCISQPEKRDLSDHGNRKDNHGCAYMRDPPTAWFTLLMVFFVNVLLGVNWIAFSVFYIHFSDEFKSSKAVTGWIGSIQVGVNQLFGEAYTVHNDVTQVQLRNCQMC